MQFWHIIFALPHKAKGRGRGFSAQDRVIKRYKEEIDSLIRSVLGEDGKYVLGYQIRPHYGFKDSQAAEIHFHVTISKVCILADDKPYAKTLESLPVKDRPIHALYLLSESMTYRPDELAAMFKDGWLKAIGRVARLKKSDLKKGEGKYGDCNNQSNMTAVVEEMELEGRGDDSGEDDDSDDDEDSEDERIFQKCKELLGDKLPLITVVTRPRQNRHDRYKLAKYTANQAAHTFRHIRPRLIDGHPDLIRIEYIDGDSGNVTGIYIMDAIEFIKQYLLKPNRASQLRHFGKGFMHSLSSFAPAVDYILKLGLRPKDSDSDNKPRRFIDLPIQHIRSRAKEFREAYLSGDNARLQVIKDQYIIVKNSNK
jgi:hypothetical protein